MSRIKRARIEDGDTIAAADLNSRFTDYAQTGGAAAGLNGFNLRDSAIDLPQLKRNWFARVAVTTTLGQFDLHHSSVNTVSATTSLPAGGHIVQDFGGTASVLSFGGFGVTVAADEILRLYWDLSARPRYTGTPWTAAGSISSYTFPDPPKSGTVDMATNGAVWVMYPEWDITSNALANFVVVPGQSDFNVNFTGSKRGAPLSSCDAASVLPAWLQIAPGALNGSITAATLLAANIGWRGWSGAWHYSGAETGAQTVYGIRWKIKGVLHPEQFSNVNYLAHDIAASNSGTVALDYTSGKCSALIHRLT